MEKKNFFGKLYERVRTSPLIDELITEDVVNQEKQRVKMYAQTDRELSTKIKMIDSEQKILDLDIKMIKDNIERLETKGGPTSALYKELDKKEERKLQLENEKDQVYTQQENASNKKEIYTQKRDLAIDKLTKNYEVKCAPLKDEVARLMDLLEEINEEIAKEEADTRKQKVLLDQMKDNKRQAEDILRKTITDADGKKISDKKVETQIRRDEEIMHRDKMITERELKIEWTLNDLKLKKSNLLLKINSTVEKAKPYLDEVRALKRAKGMVVEAREEKYQKHSLGLVIPEDLLRKKVLDSFPPDPGTPPAPGTPDDDLEDANLPPRILEIQKEFEKGNFNFDDINYITETATELTPKLARLLAKGAENILRWMVFRTLEKLTPNVAKELIKFQGELVFYGALEPSKDAFKELAKGKNVLSFPFGNSGFSNDIIEALMPHEGKILMGLSIFSPEQIELWAKHKGEVEFSSPSYQQAYEEAKKKLNTPPGHVPPPAPTGKPASPEITAFKPEDIGKDFYGGLKKTKNGEFGVSIHEDNGSIRVELAMKSENPDYEYVPVVHVGALLGKEKPGKNFTKADQAKALKYADKLLKEYQDQKMTDKEKKFVKEVISKHLENIGKAPDTTSVAENPVGYEGMGQFTKLNDRFENKTAEFMIEVDSKGNIILKGRDKTQDIMNYYELGRNNAWVRSEKGSIKLANKLLKEYWNASLTEEEKEIIKEEIKEALEKAEAEKQAKASGELPQEKKKNMFSQFGEKISNAFGKKENPADYEGMELFTKENFFIGNKNKNGDYKIQIEEDENEEKKYVVYLFGKNEDKRVNYTWFQLHTLREGIVTRDPEKAIKNANEILKKYWNRSLTDAEKKTIANRVEREVPKNQQQEKDNPVKRFGKWVSSSLDKLIPDLTEEESKAKEQKHINFLIGEEIKAGNFERADVATELDGKAVKRLIEEKRNYPPKFVNLNLEFLSGKTAKAIGQIGTNEKTLRFVNPKLKLSTEAATKLLSGPYVHPIHFGDFYGPTPYVSDDAMKILAQDSIEITFSSQEDTERFQKIKEEFKIQQEQP